MYVPVSIMFITVVETKCPSISEQFTLVPFKLILTLLITIVDISGEVEFRKN